ncbi:CaiB/BaiF CoA transferase family protein [Rhodococcus sp. NPDC057014]|uniref:CaiB/BaiF CoA transferase family protein n=1 Tax=Rhodococcus sp. NPDC057014 TaxID=3346000 RepID=UPI0036394097
MRTDVQRTTQSRTEPDREGQLSLDSPRPAADRGTTEPLRGVRVIDMTTSYAGPTATMYLADLGAEVVKVERPGGDDARQWGPPFDGERSAWFFSANRGKRSVTIDLRTPAGRDALRVLLEGADVFVVNVNPSKLARLGLDPETLRAQYPRLICCVISGFGIAGPDAGHAGYDLVAQARSGLMSVTGSKGGRPQRVSTALTDIATGMNAALGICAAVVRQQSTGEGTIVEASLLDSALALMAPRIASYLAGEPEPAPSGGTDSVLAVYQSFHTKDRDIVVAIGNDRLWKRFCELIGRPDLGGDERYADNARRRTHRAEIVDAIQAALAHRSADAWLSIFASQGIPCSLVQYLSEVVEDAQVKDRQSIVQLGDSGKLTGVRTPVRVGAATVAGLGVPELGADVQPVFAGLGLTPDQISQLHADGAFGPPVDVPSSTKERRSE